MHVKNDTCLFQLHIFHNTSNNKYYIKSQTNKCNGIKVGVYYRHLQIQSAHIPNKDDHLESAVHYFIIHRLKEQQSPSRRSNLIFTQYNIVLPNSAIRQYRLKLMYLLLMKTIGQPYDTPIDRFITDFSKKNDIIYLHVTHEIQSGIVTHKKKGRTNS